MQAARAVQSVKAVKAVMAVQAVMAVRLALLSFALLFERASPLRRTRVLREQKTQRQPALLLLLGGVPKGLCLCRMLLLLKAVRVRAVRSGLSFVALERRAVQSRPLAMLFVQQS